MAHQPLGGRPVEVVRGSNEPFPTADLKARGPMETKKPAEKVSNDGYRLTKLPPGAECRRHRYTHIIYCTEH